MKIHSARHICAFDIIAGTRNDSTISNDKELMVMFEANKNTYKIPLYVEQNYKSIKIVNPHNEASDERITSDCHAFSSDEEDNFEVDNEEHDSNHDSNLEDEILVEKEVEIRDDIPLSHENETNHEVEFFSMGPKGDGDIEDSSSEEEYFDDEFFEENEIPTKQTQGNDDVDNFDAGSDDSYDPVENDNEKSATRRKKTFDEVGRVEAVKLCPELDGSIIFNDVYAFRGYLRDYGVIGGYNFNRVKNDPDRVTAECKGEGCNWRIYASMMPHCDTFRIKTLKGEHFCVRP
ncbi:hypothetical protein ACFE04_007019 [Oxalis oulophora]